MIRLAARLPNHSIKFCGRTAKFSLRSPTEHSRNNYIFRYATHFHFEAPRESPDWRNGEHQNQPTSIYPHNFLIKQSGRELNPVSRGMICAFQRLGPELQHSILSLRLIMLDLVFRYCLSSSDYGQDTRDKTATNFKELHFTFRPQ
jgi:hypothetical protein